jgi:hypothetical protein
MQRIEILRENVGLPLELGPSASGGALLPAFVADRVKQGRLWHLIAWSDGESGTVGLWQKGQSIVLRQSELDGLSIEFMRRAKGLGWVALEASVRGQSPPVSLLQAMSFNPDALDWLLQHQAKISQVFGHHTVLNDLGSDY